MLLFVVLSTQTAKIHVLSAAESVTEHRVHHSDTTAAGLHVSTKVRPTYPHPAVQGLFKLDLTSVYRKKRMTGPSKVVPTSDKTLPKTSSAAASDRGRFVDTEDLQLALPKRTSQCMRN